MYTLEKQETTLFHSMGLVVAFSFVILCCCVCKLSLRKSSCLLNQWRSEFRLSDLSLLLFFFSKKRIAQLFLIYLLFYIYVDVWTYYISAILFRLLNMEERWQGVKRDVFSNILSSQSYVCMCIASFLSQSVSKVSAAYVCYIDCVSLGGIKRYSLECTNAWI